jgi:mono/diheme cytochrome c family protein
MNATLNTIGLVVILTLTLLSTLHAEFTAEQGIGATDYSKHCAACHGSYGKGNGPKANQLATTPTDLTLLSKINGGSFPETAVYNIIDGRRVGDFHGQEMPIWGEHFKEIEGNEEAVDERISNLIEYIKSIQAE